jgi:hypothetical protein
VGVPAAEDAGRAGDRPAARLASGLVIALVVLAWLGQARVALYLLGGITGGVAGAALLG